MGLRLHHGTAGALVAFAGKLTKQRTLALIGLAMIADDYRDFPFRDSNNH